MTNDLRPSEPHTVSEPVSKSNSFDPGPHAIELALFVLENHAINEFAHASMDHPEPMGFLQFMCHMESNSILHSALVCKHGDIADQRKRSLAIVCSYRHLWDHYLEYLKS